MAKLSSPVYAIPASDFDLMVLGRIAVGWAQIVFQIDQIMLIGFRVASLTDLKTYPTLSIKRKLGDLHKALSALEASERRTLFAKAHKSVSELVKERNVIFHGLWGYEINDDATGWLPVSRSYIQEDPFSLPDLNAFHERLVQASEAVDRAFWNLFVPGRDYPEEKNRAQMWTDGPPTGDISPPPTIPR